MLYKLPLKNSDKMVIVSEDVYEDLINNEYFQEVDLLKNLRIHSYGYAFYQKNYPKPSGGYKNVTIYLHRYIAEKFVPKPKSSKRLLVTFVNGDRLDCRTENIIWATSSQIIRNIPNHLTTDDTLSGYRGVYKLPSGNYRSAIFRGKKPFELGVYKTAEEAALAYNKKSIEWFGETRSLNKVPAEHVPQEYLDEVEKIKEERATKLAAGELEI